MTIYKYSLLLLLCLLSSFAIAQDILLSEPQRLPNKITDYDIVGMTDNGIILHKYGDRYNLLEAYSKDNLKLRWSKEFDFGHKYVTVIHIETIRNELYFFYTVKEKKNIVIFAMKTTPTLEPIGKPVALDTIVNKVTSMPFKLKMDISQDKKHFSLREKHFNIGGLDRVKFVVMDRTLEIVQNRTIKIKDKEYYKQSLLANDGSVFICTVDIKRGFTGSNMRIGNSFIRGYKPDDKEMLEVVVDQGDYIVNNVKLKMDNANDRIVLAGFYSERLAHLTTGFFYMYADLKTKTVSDKNYQAFSNEFVPKLKTSMGLKGKNQVQNMVLKEVLVRKDGGALLMGEAYHTTSQRVGGNPMFNPTAVPREEFVNYYHEDMIVISIHPDGSPFWEKVLQKKQYSEGDDGYFSSFGIVNGRSYLRLMFNEEVSYRSTLNAYELQSNGEHTMSSLVNMRDANFMMAPRYIKQLTRNMVVLPAFSNRNEFMLAKIMFE